jgi:Fe-S cluster assembly scaffold protein SufB
MGSLYERAARSDNMTTQEKATKPEVLPITAPGTFKAVEQLTDMSTEEIKGIYTALSVVEPRLKALNSAVKAGSETEKALEKFRKDLTAQRSSTPMFDAFLKDHPEYITTEEAKIADASRKAVTAEIETLTVQMSAINTHLLSVRTKYGVPPVTVKSAGKGAGSVNDGNKVEVLSVLQSRGYSDISFAPIGEGHYQVMARSSLGKIRTGRYTAQIISDWA